MRLLTRKLWRAFPELDRYADTTCRRFVRAAAGSFPRRLARFALAAGLSLIPAAAATGWSLASNRMHGSQPWLPPPTILLAACFAPALGYLIRDFLLRLRVRHVLRRRSICDRCSYSLVGIRLGADGVVLCPECGTGSRPDPSIDELAFDAAGHVSFSPPDRDPLQPFVRDSLRRRGLALIRSVATLLCLVLPAAWGGYEYFLRRQAIYAESIRPGVAGADQFARDSQPSDVSTVPEDDAWAALREASSLQRSIMFAHPRKDPKGQAVYPDFTLISQPQRSRTAEAAEADRLSRDYALELLGHFRSDGLFDAARKIASRRRTARASLSPAGMPLLWEDLLHLSESRILARIQFARVFLAAERGDVDEAADAYETCLAIARVLSAQATGEEWRTAASIELQAHRYALHALTLHPDPAWADAFAAAAARQGTADNPSHALDADRLLAIDFIAWVFSDPSRVRFGRVSLAADPVLRSLGMPADPFGQVGTFSQNLAAVETHFSRVRGFFSLPIHKRRVTPLPDSEESPLVLVRSVLPYVHTKAYVADWLAATRAALGAVIAIERYRMEHHQYPETLDELRPGLLEHIPSDPFTGEPLIYEVLDPSVDPFHRGYLLRSVGPDLTDGHATQTPGSWFNQFKYNRSREASDIVFNSPL
ncbi:MAG: hypothetical protein ACOYN0_01485 [Phycisphaerales bacterium]